MNEIIQRSHETLQSAADLGFDWPDYKTLLLALQSEFVEIEEVIENKESRERLVEEVGDLLFGCIELCRFLSIPPAESLTIAENKFTKRFGKLMEKLRSEGKEDMIGESFEQITSRWKQAKIEVDRLK